MVTAIPRTGLRVLDPVVEPDPVESVLSPRLTSLAGKRLGLLSNGKPNADCLLVELAARLEARFGLAAVVRAAKPNVSRPAPDEVMQQLSANCDFVLTAIGD